MIQVREHLVRLILDKTKSNFNQSNKTKTPSLFRGKAGGPSTNEMRGPGESGRVSREEFLNALNSLEQTNDEEVVIQEISKKWKEMSSKIRLECRFDYKFNPDKYRVGAHSFRYSVGENEMTWNTALKFLFNNVKKLILLQERLQSLHVFGNV